MGVTFVGANTATGNTYGNALPPRRDLIIVFATNFASAMTSQRPITPNSPTGQPQWIEVRNSGWRYWRQNCIHRRHADETSVVGAWVRANRCTVAIYRNAKGVKGRGVDGGAFDNNNVRYSAVTGLLSAQQPTLVAFSGTEATDAALTTTTGFTTRTSTDAVGGSAPGIGLRQNRRDWGRHPALSRRCHVLGNGYVLGHPDRRGWWHSAAHSRDEQLPDNTQWRYPRQNIYPQEGDVQG